MFHLFAPRCVLQIVQDTVLQNAVYDAFSPCAFFAFLAEWRCYAGPSNLTDLTVGGNEGLLVTEPFCDMVSQLTRLSMRCHCLMRLLDGSIQSVWVNTYIPFRLPSYHSISICSHT